VTIPKVALLTLEEKERIHSKALDILQTVGVKYDSKQSVKILADAGCEPDWDELSVRIPFCLVDEALQTVPNQVTLAARDAKKDLTYGSGKLYFMNSAQSPFFRDIDTRIRRASTSDDLIQCARLCDSLDEIDEFCPMVVPNEVSPELRGLQATVTSLRNTSKHVLKSVDLESLPFHLAILDAILGDRAELKQRPIISQIINDISPLQKDQNLIEATLALKELMVPITLYYMPMAGGTSPVTLAGTLLEMTANMLSSIVLYQTAQPGWPIIWGAGPGILDMRTGRYGSGSEAALMSMASVEMAKYYGIPSLRGGLNGGDSKEINYQAGIEAILSSVLIALAGVDAIFGPADLDGCTLVDLPLLLLATESVRQIKLLLEGASIDDEQFLFDVIGRLQFQGEYMGDPSTKRFFRREHLIPRIFPHESYEAWEARGITEEEIALEEVKKILDSYEPEPLPEEVDRELEAIMTAARDELIGS